MVVIVAVAIAVVAEGAAAENSNDCRGCRSDSRGCRSGRTVGTVVMW